MRSPTLPTLSPLRLILLVLVAATGACSPGDPPRGDVLTLLTIDTLRADRLGCYGAPTARTPRLDRMARSGLQFPVAIAPVPLTLPSHTTILSGLVPPDHGARNNGFFRVPEDVPLVSESFADAGWETAAFVAAFPLASRFGLARGFDVYRDATETLPDGTRASRPDRNAHRVNEELMVWLDGRVGNAPLFLWTHYFDPHAPYVRHPPRKFPVRDAYAGEVAFVDRQFTRLVRRLEDEFQNVRICVTADHGESLGDHGEDNHGIFVYESTTRVPLFFAGPDAPQGRLVRSPASLTRIAPTLLKWAGVNADPFESTALPWPSGNAPSVYEPTDPVYAESLLPEVRLGCAPLRALRSARWKVIRAPEPEIYDLLADPGELHNLYTDPRAREAASSLLMDIEDPRWDGRALDREHIDEQTETLLASLGYVSTSNVVGASYASAPREALPDPKHRIELLRHVSIAKGYLAVGRLREASRAADAALAVDPDHKESHILVGQLEARAGNSERAIETFEHCLDLPPETANATVYFEMGNVELAAGRPEQAESYFELSARENPLNANAFFLWGQTAYALNRITDAVERWRVVLNLDPGHSAARDGLRKAEERLRRTR